MKIVGIEERIGVYEDNPFHNVNLHCAEEFGNNDKSEGLKVSIVKVKYNVLTKTFGKELTTLEIKSLVGKDVEEFHYDRYGNVSLVEFVDSTETSKK